MYSLTIRADMGYKKKDTTEEKSVFRANRRLENILQLSKVQTKYEELPPSFSTLPKAESLLLIVENIFGQTRPSSSVSSQHIVCTFDNG